MSKRRLARLQRSRERSLVRYVARRILALAALLLVASFGVFSLLYVSPGDPIDILLGDAPRTPQTVQAVRDEYHLDEPFLEQYWIWLKGAAHLDFGKSIQTSLPVSDTIRSRLPISLFLGLYAYVLTLAVGIALGIWSALKKESALDRGIAAGAILGLSTPVFVTGIYLLYLFSVVLGWFPSFGAGVGFSDRLSHLTLPAIALAFHSAAYLVRHTRAAMVNALDTDYVTFARARGLSSQRILFLYALRNALIPVVTISGLVLAGLIAGAVLVEVTFSLPGIGGLLVESASVKDLPMLQAVALVIAVVIMTANLIADLLYLAVDPRLRLGARAA